MGESATERQKVKLHFFGIKFSPTITKEQASSLLDQIDDPARETAYREYRDQLDAKQSEADDLGLRIEAWRASVEMRDDMYHKISRRIIRWRVRCCGQNVSARAVGLEAQSRSAMRS